ncbi:MAG: UvrD-helicase domain-containing protein [Halieaceae bacterium]|jgi:ATP-dependent exoDNAse (exonuclease V) beta subunit|nr:UvrD-helicase domain-containing protein [Halieaceae bacterium]
MSVVDAAERARAIDPAHSFCVSAPAGSGKTELLIQRYLRLLSRVERPEQILAITFTRKAAAEMRERVVDALLAARHDEPCDSIHQQVTRQLAQAALAADEHGGWQLVRDISRLNIKTIDSFCGGLTRQMPVLSEFGGQASLLDDASELYARAVVELFRRVDDNDGAAADMKALMLHFDNNWERLQSLLVAMLARRDQWRHYVGVHHAPEESEAYLVATVRDLVRGELGTLDERLGPYRGELLDLMQYAAANLGEPGPVAFPGTEPGDMVAWRRLRTMLLTNAGTWRKRLDKSMGFPAGKGLPGERKAQLNDILAELAQLDGLEQMVADISILPEIDTGSESWRLLIHLSRLLPQLAAELLLVFQREGAVDHSQVALSALQALGDDDAPTELALRLDYQIEHILVDEFQDTAINQYELVHALTRGWGQHNETNPQAPRTVMIVGDGMQSIYGFRGANVGLFLKARLEGFNGVRLEHLQLRCNFRSEAGLVEWVNASFAAAFPATDDINRGRVRFTPAAAVRTAGVSPAVGLHAFQGDDATGQEIAFVCAQIAEAWADPACASIAVLGRSRGHLAPVISGLQQLSIPYSAQAMDSLARCSLVGDLVTLCRALACDADRLAWLSLLRAPWCGLCLADLLRVGRWGDSARYTPVWCALQDSALRQSLTADGRQRVEALLPALQSARQKRDRLGLRAWVELTWLQLGGPATAPDSAALTDAESFFQLLEQAEHEGRGLDVQWLQSRLDRQFMNGGESGSKVQIMTLHKAKGLEFDCVFIPQLARISRGDDRELLLWDEHSGPGGKRSFLLAADDHSEKGAPTLYNYLDKLRKDKSQLESTRLLYVGATRAIRRLVLSASLQAEPGGELRPPPSRSLLWPIWDSFRQALTLHEAGPAPVREASAPGRTLLRLQPAAAPAVLAPGAAPEGDGANIPPRAENYLERCVGTVVHMALDELSRRDELPRSPERRDIARWRTALAALGLWGPALDQAQGALESALATTLAPEGEGRWILSNSHRQPRSEWALTRVDPASGRVEDLVIDRSFVDPSSDVRWLIDYKTSRPGPDETLEAFFIRQAEAYREQLLRYRNALRELGGEAIRCALYFTSVGQLYHMKELDLGARE